MTTGEQFVDYSGFTYNRSETFKGSVTWLDVPTLKWKVSKITDVVPFTNLSSLRQDRHQTLTGVTAFAQLADDVRALCNFIPDNTFLPGFYMDVPGVDTTEEQVEAIHEPRGRPRHPAGERLPDLPVPDHGVPAQPLGRRRSSTRPSCASRSTPPDAARGRGRDRDRSSDGRGDPVRRRTPTVTSWARGDPHAGFPVAPGYNVSTTFDVTVADGAPIGAYTVTLELIDVDAPATVLASDTGTITVNDNVATVMWGDSVPKLATQGVYMTIPLQVYSPADGTVSRLT